MDIEQKMIDNFEYWEATGRTHEEIEEGYGRDVLQAYINWIYEECK